MEISEAEFRAAKKVNIAACGTSWHAGQAGKFMIGSLARVPVEVDYASEWRYRNPIIVSDTLTILISQSSETADTIAAQREAKAKGSKTIAICNVVGSMITRESGGTIYTHAGPEIGVASTKAFTTPPPFSCSPFTWLS
jgi:glucosamine--fructose-6-phosphate aminotransferase (isomerizing)